MGKPAFVAASDLHLEYNAYANYPQMWGDSYWALERIVDKALELRVPLVLPGDLFDKTYPDSFTLKQMFAQMDRLEELGLPCYYTQGQHELNRRQPWMSLHPWPTHLHQKCASAGGVLIQGLDYLPADQLAEAMNGLSPTAEVLICHQVWAEFMGTVTAPEGSLAQQLPANFKLVVTGDFHGHKALKQTSARGHLFTILTPGSACLQNVAEDPDKYFYVVDDDLTYHSVPIMHRPVFYSHVDSPARLEEELARAGQDGFAASLAPLSFLPPNLRSAMWVVTYDPDAVPEAARVLTQLARKKGYHLFLRTTQKPLEAASAGADEAQVVSGLEEALATLVDRESPVYASALALLRSKEPKQTLNELIERLLSSGALEPEASHEMRREAGPALSLESWETFGGGEAQPPEPGDIVDDQDVP